MRFYAYYVRKYYTLKLFMMQENIDENANKLYVKLYIKLQWTNYNKKIKKMRKNESFCNIIGNVFFQKTNFI